MLELARKGTLIKWINCTDPISFTWTKDKSYGPLEPHALSINHPRLRLMQPCNKNKCSSFNLTSAQAKTMAQTQIKLQVQQIQGSKWSLNWSFIQVQCNPRARYSTSLLFSPLSLSLISKFCPNWDLKLEIPKNPFPLEPRFNGKFFLTFLPNYQVNGPFYRKVAQIQIINYHKESSHTHSSLRFLDPLLTKILTKNPSKANSWRKGLHTISKPYWHNL